MFTIFTIITSNTRWQQLQSLTNQSILSIYIQTDRPTTFTYLQRDLQHLLTYRQNYNIYLLTDRPTTFTYLQTDLQHLLIYRQTYNIYLLTERPTKFTYLQRDLQHLLTYRQTYNIYLLTNRPTTFTFKTFSPLNTIKVPLMNIILRLVLHHYTLGLTL